MEVIGVGGHRGKGKGFHNIFEWGGGGLRGCL